MKSLRSTRARLALGAAGVVLVLGSILGGVSYFWLATTLDDEIRSFAQHEAQELANLVASLETRDEVLARQSVLNGLFPEDGVIGLAIFSLDEKLVHSMPAQPGPWSEPWPPGFRAARAEQPIYERIGVPGAGDAIRTALRVDLGREPRWLVMATVSAERTQAAKSRFRVVFSAALACTLFLAFLGCYALLSLALEPLGRMVEVASQMAEGAPAARLEEPDQDAELRELAALLDRMLERSRLSLESLRLFTSHAGHELRTPLARLRAEAEHALTRQDPALHRECIESVLEEASELERVVDGLLELAQVESGELPDQEAVAIEPLLSGLVQQASEVGEPRQVSLRSRGGPYRCRGIRILLERAVWNLLDNAIKFSAPGGRIEVRLDGQAGELMIEVADDGPGVPEADRQRVFEAFRRGSKNARGVAGHGLGLALARAVIRRHGGRLDVSTDPELGGARFSVHLPGSTG